MPSPSQSVKRFEWRRAVFKSALDSKTKLVLLALAEHAGDKAEAWPSITRLAEHTSLSRNSVKAALANAIAEGWITAAERYTQHGGQTSNAYLLTNLDPRPTTGHPPSTVDPPQPTTGHPPATSWPPPGQPLATNKNKEADQRSSKQISPVIREVWADLAGAAAVPDALGDYTLGQQESAALEAAGAVKAGRAHNPVGLLLSLVRNLAGDAPRVSAEAIRAALAPEPVAAEPMRPEWRLFTKEPEPVLTPEEKAAQRAEIEEAKRQARILFGIEEVAS